MLGRTRCTVFAISCMIAVSLFYNIHINHFISKKRSRGKPNITRHVVTSTTQYVLILHSTGDTERMKAVRDTWFRETEQIGLVVMMKNTETSAFETTRTAVARALQLFPDALHFGKFDDDTYVYTKELFSRASSFNYSGYPIKDSDGFVFGSGGAGYVLSRGAAEVVARCVPVNQQFEDVAVGTCLREVAPLHDLIGLHPHHPYQMLRWDKHGHPSDRVHRREPLDGYLNPLSYHYINPTDMVRMHGVVRGGPLPRILHQFWEGDKGRPEMWLQKCHENHLNWEHIVWSNSEIRSRFPSAESTVGFLPKDGTHGELVNQDLYSGALNLLSDIMRYEVLMLYGGVYVDADTECFRPMDYLVDESIVGVQGFAFLEKDTQYMGGLVASGVIGTYAFSPLSVALVSELQHTDWSLPPWQSAGPMYFTKIMRLLEGRVKILDSHHVYPFHHSDMKPDHLHQHLVRMGAVMDQKWGTTHDAYTTSSWFEDNPKKNNKQHHYQETHRIGLSTLAREQPRWVVAILDPQAGLCNRIMHILSTLVFAMATERVLLFDWIKSTPRKHENGIEMVGHSDYHDLFQAPLQHSYSQALEKFGWTNERTQWSTITIGPDDLEFTHNLLSKDLDEIYSQSVVFIARNDWWAHSLLTNPLYISNKTSEELFSELFRFMFSPLHAHKLATDCDWLIHRRAQWERQTANLSAFENCGKSHGMHSTPILLQDGCRDSLSCDTEAIRQMYTFAGCKHALLTATSTFGACIAGLGRIRDTYVVSQDGVCTKKIAVDPIDAGTLNQVTPERAKESHPKHTAIGAAVYKPTDAHIESLLQILHNETTHIPLVLLTDQPRAMWAFLPFVIGRRVRFNADGYTTIRWLFNNSYP